MTNDVQSATAIAVYVGLGSNIGNREANLREAIDRIEKSGLEVVRQSSIYETEPVGYKDQPWFLNQVIEIRVTARPCASNEAKNTEETATNQAKTLLSELLKIEAEMGRERTIADGPRVIDIDLLLFGDAIILPSKQERVSSVVNQNEIFVPHPRMHLRRFVLQPLCEIAPSLEHPVQRKTCSEILASLVDDSETRIYKG